MARTQRRTDIPKTTNTVVGSEAVYDDIQKGKKAMEKLGNFLDEHIDWEKEQGAGAGKGKDKDKKGSKQSTYPRQKWIKLEMRLKRV